MTKIHEVRFVEDIVIRHQDRNYISSYNLSDFPLLLGAGRKHVRYFDPYNPLDVLSGQYGDFHVAIKVTVY
jgi:hypothetical protein